MTDELVFNDAQRSRGNGIAIYILKCPHRSCRVFNGVCADEAGYTRQYVSQVRVRSTFVRLNVQANVPSAATNRNAWVPRQIQEILTDTQLRLDKWRNSGSCSQQSLFNGRNTPTGLTFGFAALMNDGASGSRFGFSWAFAIIKH